MAGALTSPAIALAVAAVSLSAFSSVALAGQLLRVDIKSNNVNNSNSNPTGGSAGGNFQFPPEGGTLTGSNPPVVDSTIGPQSSPAFEDWNIAGGQVVDLGTGEVTVDNLRNRFDYTSRVRPGMKVALQAGGGELINTIARFNLPPPQINNTAGPYYFNEVYRDFAVVSPPLVNPNVLPTMSLTITDEGTTLAPNSAYNVTVFAYDKFYDASGNNESPPASDKGNTTMHFTDRTEGGLGSSGDSYFFTRQVIGGSPTSNPDSPPGYVLNNYTWSATLTVFTDAAGDIVIDEVSVSLASLNAQTNPLGTNDPSRASWQTPILSAFEVNDDVVKFVGAAGASWGTASNWSPGPNGAAAVAPDGASQIANFFSTGNQSVQLDAPRTLGTLNFNAAVGSGTTITNAGSHTITLDSLKGPNTSVSIASRAGNHVVNASVVAKDRIWANVNAGSTLAFTGDLTTATTAMTERTTNTTVNVNQVLFLNKTGGGTLAFRSINGVPIVRVQSGTLRTTGGVSSTPSLVISMNNDNTPAATLDVSGSSGWIIDYTDESPLALLQTLLTFGRNGGAWNGAGLTNSTAAATGRYGIALLEASDLIGAINFPGSNVPLPDSTAVLIRSTLLGDFNLDGTVNFPDLLTLAKNYNGTGKGWLQGDSNYDGTVNFPDLLSLAKNYNGTAGTLEGDWALALSMVPEPTTLAAMGMAGTLILRRRQRAV